MRRDSSVPQSSVKISPLNFYTLRSMQRAGTMVPIQRAQGEKQSSEVVWTASRRHKSEHKTSEEWGGSQAHGNKNCLYICWEATNHIYIDHR